MRNKPRSISNSRTRGALFARSFKSRAFSHGRRSGALARVRVTTRRNLEQGRITLSRFFVISSGNCCFSCVLQNAPCGMPDVLQTSTPALVSFQSAAVVLKRSWRALQCPTKVLKDLTK